MLFLKSYLMIAPLSRLIALISHDVGWNLVSPTLRARVVLNDDCASLPANTWKIKLREAVVGTEWCREHRHPWQSYSLACRYLSQLSRPPEKWNLKNSKPKVTDFEHESLFEVYKYSLMMEPTRSCVSRANKSNVPWHPRESSIQHPQHVTLIDFLNKVKTNITAKAEVSLTLHKIELHRIES